MLSLADYTVGWICALDIELAAARGMLDECHSPQVLPPKDWNSYTLGRIGAHNVVIACLPQGVMGTIAAAQVATKMDSTFTDLKFGLMVGIGGGVPSEEHDIRLGDVVVSTPTGKSPGVVQYDMGKTVQEGRFDQTGSLNKPAQVLLTALTNLKSKLHDLTKYVSEMARKYHGQDPPFTHPRIQDSLYEANYDHPPGFRDCSECEAEKLVHRKPRHSEDPVVHYGLIASGNQVMRHGTTRDRLRQEHDFLCYEMEAAGLMDVIPCLVIRGICDYADSHKNKSWQPYAAATAAAYAKELLNTIPGYQVAGTRTIKNFIELISPSNPWITEQDISSGKQEGTFDIDRRDALERTPLHRAASMGHTHVVELLLDRNADIAARSYDLFSPLGFAAQYGHEPVARVLLERGAARKMTQPEKMRALYDAFFGGHQAVFRLLVENNFDGTRHNPPSPVHTVVASRDTTALKRLLSGEVDINVKGLGGQTPLHIAVAQNDLSSAELLLDHGADVTVTNSMGFTPLSLARRNYEMLQKLIDKRPEQINAPEDRFMHTVLILVAVERNLTAVKFLLSKGANPSICDIFEETPLHYAAEGGHLDIVQALVEAGSDLQVLDTGGRTPLRCAQLNQHSAVVDYLAPRTRAVENWRGWTELHYASWTGHWLLVIKFMNAGFSVSAQAHDGATPLHLAAEGGHLVVVKSLLAAGANRKAPDKENRTPLDYAKQNGKNSVVQYLNGTGTGEQVHDEEHRTPWAHLRCKECVNHRYLLEPTKPHETKQIVECPN
jgi:ankyrin repeat protein/nucleoside phosphorylase